MGYEVYEMLIREINLSHSKILLKISSHNKEEKPPKIYLFAEQEFMYPTFSMLMAYETSFQYLFNVLTL